MKQGTPVIIRSNERGNVVGICPTLRGHISDVNQAQLLKSNGEFGKFEAVASFMERTEDASNREVRKFLELVNEKYSGNYYAVDSETPAMRKARITSGL
jgi:hypothetical protein